jgi:ribonuclease P protein component
LLRRGYQKKDRIRKRPEYLHLAEDGRRLFSRHFILVYARRNDLVSRLGVTVTKKIGNAVSRNRLKRLCREYFRTHRDHFAGAFDVHVIARSGSAQAANDELNQSLEKLFSQIE